MLFTTRHSRFLVLVSWFVMRSRCSFVRVVLFLLLLFATPLLLCHWQLVAPRFSFLLVVWSPLLQVVFVFGAGDKICVRLLLLLRRLSVLRLIPCRLLLFFLSAKRFHKLPRWEGCRLSAYWNVVCKCVSTLRIIPQC